MRATWVVIVRVLIYLLSCKAYNAHFAFNSCTVNMSSTDFSSTFKNKTKEEVILNIEKLRKAIKKKHRTLKQDSLASETSWENKIKPISEPLQKLFEASESLMLKDKVKEEIQNSPSSILKKRLSTGNTAPPQRKKRRYSLYKLPLQSDLQTGYESENAVDGYSSSVARKLIMPDEQMELEVADKASASDEIQNLPEVYESEIVSGEHLLATPEGRDIAKDYVNSQFKGRIAKDYFLKLINKGRAIDTTYGLRVSGDSWMIGDKYIEIDGDDIIINDKRYEGTRGLYELLFMNVPNEYIYDENDLENYKSILLDTNVHRVGYTSRGKLRSSRGQKYKNIISSLVSHESAYSGKGLNVGIKNVNHMLTYADLIPGSQDSNIQLPGSGLTHSNTEPNFTYWNDPNELIERLRILGASKEAGNTGHTNEINAIIEELLEYDRQQQQLSPQ